VILWNKITEMLHCRAYILKRRPFFSNKGQKIVPPSQHKGHCIVKDSMGGARISAVWGQRGPEPSA